MANNNNSDGIQSNHIINESNDSNNNVFNLEDLSKELVEFKSELKEVNQLTKHLQKELTKEKANKGKQRNEKLVKTDSQESETKVDEKLKDLPHLEPLFEEFDAKYFKGILKKNNVKVKYSKRLSVNCGVCRNESVITLLYFLNLFLMS
jgi:SPX domain protein involved in polyphosphate accumulation